MGRLRNLNPHDPRQRNGMLPFFCQRLEGGMLAFFPQTILEHAQQLRAGGPAGAHVEVPQVEMLSAAVQEPDPAAGHATRVVLGRAAASTEAILRLSGSMQQWVVFLPREVNPPAASLKSGSFRTSSLMDSLMHRIAENTSKSWRCFPRRLSRPLCSCNSTRRCRRCNGSDMR